MRRLWLDLGELGAFVSPSSPFDLWQDHGLGLLRTLMAGRGLASDVRSTRAVRNETELAALIAGYDLLLMNVRSYTYPIARQAARVFKEINPNGIVAAGGMHATVAEAEMTAVADFDCIVQGSGEGIIVDLATDPGAFPRVAAGVSARTMDEWPPIDRTLWPRSRRPHDPWPLEPECGWGPGPVATILTSRVCPWQCAFCNEASFIASMGRRSPEAIVDELNALDARFGPLGSVVIHDSMFFQQPAWLARWIDAYTTRARTRWPYWAAARADTIRRWPDLFEALIRETNWQTISIGFESGSDRVLRTLNKECTAEDNAFAIELVNRIGDDYVRQGLEPPRFWANIMLAVPGETRDDAFDTMRMVRAMRYRQVSPSLYSPYPGSILGYQLIAEGASLLTDENYHRYPHDEKVRGVDYAFYRDLLAGRYDPEIARSPWPPPAADPGALRPGHHIYLFDHPNGRQTLAYGTSTEDALDTLRLRLPRGDVDKLDASRARTVPQREVRRHLDRLG